MFKFAFIATADPFVRTGIPVECWRLRRTPNVFLTASVQSPLDGEALRLARMASDKQKDLLTRLSDAGEEALSRVAGSQTTNRVVETIGGMRERVDDMQKKLRGLDALEKRVAKLEKRIDELAKPKRRTAASSRRSTTARRSTTPKKPPS
jgi:hypothetical protein